MKNLTYTIILLLLCTVATQSEIIWQPKMNHAAFTMFGHSLIANPHELYVIDSRFEDANQCVEYSDQTDAAVCNCLDSYGVSEFEFNNQ